MNFREILSNVVLNIQRWIYVNAYKSKLQLWIHTDRLNQSAVRNNRIVLLEILLLNMSKCARRDCHMAAKSSCSGCDREQYCGSACQKLDWKIHKSMCPILKKLSDTLQPYHEVVQVIKEILASKKGDNVRILEYLLQYADYQLENQS
jgi:hypothetical protein